MDADASAMTTTGEAFAFYAWLVHKVRSHAFDSDPCHGWSCDMCRALWRAIQ